MRKVWIETCAVVHKQSAPINTLRSSAEAVVQDASLQTLYVQQASPQLTGVSCSYTHSAATPSQLLCDNASAVLETELFSSRQPDTRIKTVFASPSGAHVLVCIKTSNNYELQYIHSSWQKPRNLGKLKGIAVTAVGWQKQPDSSSPDRSSSTDEDEQQQLLVSTG